MNHVFGSIINFMKIILSEYGCQTEIRFDQMEFQFIDYIQTKWIEAFPKVILLDSS